MLVLFALFASAQDAAVSAAATPSEAQEEIRVIRRKLRDWRGTIRLGDHATGCVTKRSSGDPDIDRIRCDAMTACVPKFEPELKNAFTTTTDKAVRARTTADINRRMTACFDAEHEARIAALADRRAAQRADAEPHR